MTLAELADEYEKSAIPLRERLSLLRKELKSAETPDERWVIKRRIAELTPMLTQCNRISKYCRRYYERGFYIGDGALECESKPGRTGKVEQLATQGTPLHIEKRTYTKPTSGG